MIIITVCHDLHNQRLQQSETKNWIRCKKNKLLTYTHKIKVVRLLFVMMHFCLRVFQQLSVVMGVGFILYLTQ